MIIIAVVAPVSKNPVASNVLTRFQLVVKMHRAIVGLLGSVVRFAIDRRALVVIARPAVRPFPALKNYLLGLARLSRQSAVSVEGLFGARVRLSGFSAREQHVYRMLKRAFGDKEI